MLQGLPICLISRSRIPIFSSPLSIRRGTRDIPILDSGNWRLWWGRRPGTHVGRQGPLGDSAIHMTRKECFAYLSFSVRDYFAMQQGKWSCKVCVPLGLHARVVARASTLCSSAQLSAYFSSRTTALHSRSHILTTFDASAAHSQYLNMRNEASK